MNSKNASASKSMKANIGMRVTKYLAVIILTLSWPVHVFAQEVSYAAGNGALELWNRQGIANSPKWVQYWLVIMMSSFALGLLFIWKHIEARFVVGGLIAGLLVSKFVPEATGLAPLSGLVALVHLIFWTPGLYLLMKNRPFAEGRSFYAIWSAWISAVIIFSFIFDVRDAAIYLDYMMGLGFLS